MKFEIENAVEVLSATPGTLWALLGGLSDGWTGAPTTRSAEAAATPPPAGGESRAEWQAFDVVGHLIHGEETDWIPRARIILEQGENRTFVPFDRFAQFENSKGKSLSDLLTEFEAARAKSLSELRSWNLTGQQLELKGMHPELGEVSLSQLLATWVVHDLNHVRQIATAIAYQYNTEVGPWKEYLSILK